MIIKKYLFTVLFIFTILATPASALTEKEITFLETYGWIVGQQSGIVQLGLSSDELEILIKGLRVANEGKGSPHDHKLIGAEMQEYFKARAAANSEKYQKQAKKNQDAEAKKSSGAAQKNKDAGHAFIKKLLSENKNIKKTSSGLYYEIIGSGSDNKPTATDKIEVHYEGKLISGQIFDSSIKRGKTITFPLNGVIPGWTEGLQLIGESGKIKLYIPSDLAYGDKGNPSIPPGSTLIFDVELIKINPVQTKAMP